MGLLSNVGVYSQYNKMTGANLALIFGPNLMWSPDNPLGGAMGTMKGLNNALQLMISHFEKVFESQPEVRGSEDHHRRSVLSSDDDADGDSEENGTANVLGSVDLT